MLNERDDNKYENPEESEYHFSDEEVSYEVETESPKASATSEQKENVFNRLTRSKRMLISLAVFLVLVFVVYKMVAPPSSPTQPTDITAPVTVAQNQQKPLPATTTTQVTTSQPAPAVPTVSNLQPPPPPSVTATTTVATPPVPQQTAAQPPVVQVQTTSQIPSGAPTEQPVQTQITQTSQPSQPLNQAPPAIPTSQAQYPQQVANVAAVIPATQTQSTTTTTVTQPTAIGAVGSQLPPGADVRMAALASENEKLANQLQAEYAQKINDYASQNKALQDQVQTLNTRVASMETQMNQLVQALTRQAGQAQGAAATAQAAQAQPERDVRVPYNVQAIIPGRAWLRSDSGETVTVAEGDMVKDLGRVTKIDPYDGVVEINTGTKVVSLSYGNGV